MTLDDEQHSDGLAIDADAQLVAQAKKELPNRTSAYEALICKYEKLLYRVCYRVMGNVHDAEDVFQEVMLKVFNGLIRFESRSSFKTWLFAIAHNTCYSAISRLAKAREFNAYLSSNDDGIEGVQMQDAEIQSEKMLASLNVQDREILTLKYVVELSFDEIAEVLSLSPSAAKMRVYRATDLLKAKFK